MLGAYIYVSRATWWVLRGSNSRHSPCKGDALPTELSTPSRKIAGSRTGIPPEKGNQFIASLRALPGRNLGTRAAPMRIVSPVCGLRPARASRLPT
jgi:hypothetical protein